VSICVPAYNSDATIAAAIGSALRQDYEHFEVVVVDDCSTDQTPEVIRSFASGRLRLYKNSTNRGHARTANAAVNLARGDLIKFLHDDDELEPGCLSAMVPIFEDYRNVGLVFSRRKVVADPSDDADLCDWLERYRAPQRAFGERLKKLSNGPSLASDWLHSGLPDNWIGEPVAVMARKDCLELVGGFSLRVMQAQDTDLWLRLMSHFDVGFIDRDLATYRRRASSLTTANRQQHRDWLDSLWLLESLAWTNGSADPWLRAWRRRELWQAAKSAVREADDQWPRRRRLRDLGAYLCYRVRLAVAAQPPPFGLIAASGAMSTFPDGPAPYHVAN
jgi:glycosyltransferase involved in cell wall biosynthesis